MNAVALKQQCAAHLAPDIAPRDMAIIGAVVGAISAIGPLYEAEPLLYFFPIAWFLFVVSRFFTLLRYPRRETLAFILGMSYETRTAMCLRFIHKKARELFVACAVATVAFFCMRAIAYRNIAWSETLVSSQIMFGIALVLWGLLFVMVRGRIIRPTKRDISRLQTFFSFFKIGKGGMLIRLTQSVLTMRVPFLSKDPAMLLRRQTLYLLRFNPLELFFFFATACAVTIVVFVYAPRSQDLALCMFSCIVPAILLFETTPALSESASKLATCPYYPDTAAPLLRVNMLIALVIALPWTIAAAACIGSSAHPLSLIIILRLAATIVAAGSLAVVSAFRWLEDDWSPHVASCMGCAILCALIGISVPLYGIVFPSVALIGTVLVCNKVR